MPGAFGVMNVWCAAVDRAGEVAVSDDPVVIDRPRGQGAGTAGDAVEGVVEATDRLDRRRGAVYGVGAPLEEIGGLPAVGGIDLGGEAGAGGIDSGDRRVSDFGKRRGDGFDGFVGPECRAGGVAGDQPVVVDPLEPENSCKCLADTWVGPVGSPADSGDALLFWPYALVGPHSK